MHVHAYTYTTLHETPAMHAQSPPCMRKNDDLPEVSNDDLPEVSGRVLEPGARHSRLHFFFLFYFIC